MQSTPAQKGVTTEGVISAAETVATATFRIQANQANSPAPTDQPDELDEFHSVAAKELQTKASHNQSETGNCAPPVSGSSGWLRDINNEQHQQQQQHLQKQRQTSRTPEPISPNKNLEQRIKVTLSAPRNSTDQQLPPAEPILFDSTLDNAEQNQSTGNLISCASGSSSSGISREPKRPPVVHLSRADQENELRRIASQRRNIGSPSSFNKQANKPPTVATPGGPAANNLPRQQQQNQRRQQQQQQQVIAAGPQSDASNQKKQLAIYINGKIRSNSIFCQSNSVSSFSSILNRFSQHPTSASVNTCERDQSISESGEHLEGEGTDQGKQQQQSALNQIQQNQRHLKRRYKTRCKSRDLLLSNLRSAAQNLRRYLQASPVEGKRKRGKRHKRSESSESGSSSSNCTSHSSSLCPPELQVAGLSEGSAAGLPGKLASQSSKDNLRDQTSCEQEANKSSYKLNPSSMFLRKAMRYYRLWIYCTNITILLATLIFILSAIYVASDYRIRLVVGPGRPANRGERAQEEADYDISVSYSESSVVLAYAVIFVQAGLLQAIGCFGAIRMKERWIQAFWYLILALTAFDVVFLLHWLNRYDFMVKSLHHHMTMRLNEHYGGALTALASNYTTLPLPTNHHTDQSFSPTASSSAAGTSSTSSSSSSPSSSRTFTYSSDTKSGGFVVHDDVDSKFDKILTQIIDKIQADSQCCGISNSLDYKRTRWRAVKLNQLSAKLNWTTDDSQVASLLRRAPLVPASCCRRQPVSEAGSAARKQNRPVILDDSQLDRPPRVPAWSPSMMVEELQLGQQRRQQRPRTTPAHKLTAAGQSTEGSSRHKEEGSDDDDSEDGGEQDNELNGTNNRLSLDELLDRRWTGTDADHSGAERRLSSQQRRLQAKQEYFSYPDTDHVSLKQQDEPEEDSARPDAYGQSDRMRRWLVESRVDSQQQTLSRSVEEPPDISVDNGEFADKLMEGEGEESAAPGDNKLARLAALRRILFLAETAEANFSAHHFRRPNELQLSYEQYCLLQSYLLSEEGSGRERRSPIQQEAGSSSNKQANNELDELAKRRRDQLAELLREDPETSCAPRSYFDQATIYTHGCQPAIKAWLDTSAHILFVTGFCVLTVLKFCSAILLRLEIKEMIHKIRVLKGMATEYNALHDLEAYLPRPSLCAQAAELTPSGVSPAVGGSSGTIAVGGAQVATARRLGGSFSEAVAAATAAATGVSSQLSLASSGRAASMKAMAAVSQMLAPGGVCPRSSSASAAHLQAAASLLNHQNTLSPRSDLFQPSSLMSRRHTAVSVCPAAAAAAAAAAHALMSRRGTYVANPMFNTAPLMQPEYLSQHRHSAHTLATASGQLLKPQFRQQISCPKSHSALDSARRKMAQLSMEHQNSIEPSQLSCQQQQQQQHLQQQQPRNMRSSGGSHQLLSLLSPFKRQSSQGTQSACNFPLDNGKQLSASSRQASESSSEQPPAALCAESRRSIH